MNQIANPKPPTSRSLARTLRKGRGTLAKELLPLVSSLTSCDDETMGAPESFRVCGPYKDGKGYRVVIFEGNVRRSVFAENKDQAETIKAQVLKRHDDRASMTIGQAIEEFMAEKLRAGLKTKSAEDLNRTLRQFLPLPSMLERFTAQRAQELYTAETQRVGRFGLVRVATHHRILRVSKAFFAWTVENGYLAENPFANVKAIGRASAGKPQLRQDEARKLNDLCLSRAADGDEGALAVLVQLVMGLRSAEVLALRVRDLDGGGKVLVIDGTKTPNARRSLDIESEPLRELLGRHCAGKDPSLLMFGSERTTPFATDKLFKTLRKLCKAADVPIVCPHSLRGLHSSLAVSRGATSRFVAQALGHGSDAVTKRHYIAPGTIESASAKHMAEVLGAPALPPDLAPIADTLRALSQAQIEMLLASVGKGR